MTRIQAQLTITAVPDLPRFEHGDDVATKVAEAIDRARLRLLDDDILVVTSKILAKVDGRWVDLATVTPSPSAEQLAVETGKDARLVELILRESTAVSRKAYGTLLVRHHLGFIAANAGIDASNVGPAHVRGGTGPWVLLLPKDPDGWARRLRTTWEERFRVRLGVVVTDSWGRPFREGTVGFALGCAGLPPLIDHRGRLDMDGRRLEHTRTALADQVAAAADMVAGQAAESRPVILLRGIHWSPSAQGAADLLRSPQHDLYA